MKTNALLLLLSLPLIAFAAETAKKKKTIVMPKPVAAGTSPSTQPPKASAIDVSEGSENEEDDGPTSLEGANLPEPFFCEFKFDTEKKLPEWSYVGSDYPRQAPPFTTRQVISDAYSRHASSRGPSWGFCVEAEPTVTPTDMKLDIFAHISLNGKSTPSLDVDHCGWKPATTDSHTTIQNAKTPLALKITQWGGVEIKTSNGERVRFSAHWPIKTQPDQDGVFCRDFAAAMNKKTFESARFKKLKL